MRRRWQALASGTSFSASAAALMHMSLTEIFTPLSAKGLWEAEIMAPGIPSRLATQATVGVGTTPSSSASAPAPQMPAARAASSMGPDRRVSRPIT